MTTLAQRIGSLSRLIFYPETTPGTDPGSPVGVVLPLRDASGFKISQNTIEAPIFNGTLLPYSATYGEVSGGGTIPLEFEFLTSPNLLKAMFGAATKTTLVTGYLHQFYITSTFAQPGSAQLQNEFLETTAVYERQKYCRVGAFKVSHSTQGVVPLDVTMMSSGDEAFTDLGGTKTDNGYSAVSAFNGQVQFNSTSVIGLVDFDWTLDAGLSRQSVAFNSGVAGAINPSCLNAAGKASLVFATTGSGLENDFTFYNYGVNQTLIPIDVIWTDAPMSASPFPTSFFRVQMPSCLFSRESVTAGGKAGKIHNGSYKMTNNSSPKTAAEAFGTVVGPYAIVTGTNDKASFKIDGGSVITTTLTASGTKTAAQLVAELNANGTFAAAATADVFMGRVRVTSKTKGTTSSVQFDTTVANNCAATLGFNSTAISGFATPLLISVWNSQSASY